MRTKYINLGNTDMPSFFFKPILIFIFVFCFCYFIIGGKYEEIVRRNNLNNLRRENKKILISFKKSHELNILILMVITNQTNIEEYEIAMSTMKCYAKIQNYQFMIVIDSDYDCPQKDKFFRRHCVVAKILLSFDVILFVDADIGVVNPKRRIEEFLNLHDIIFYDRFYNWEVAMGSYIVRRSEYSINFLKDFSNFESQLPDSFHGSDNGAINLYLAQHLFPQSRNEIDLCKIIYRKSMNFRELFIFEACIRKIFRGRNNFERLQILPKGTGWVRDSWLTSGKWHPNIDFMLHGWKSANLRQISKLEINKNRKNANVWFNPLAGTIQLEKCSPMNSTWTYVSKLIGVEDEIQEELKEVESRVSFEQKISASRIEEFY